MGVPAVSVPASAASHDGLVHALGSILVDTKRTCARIAASDATVLLLGETGTGKEVFARFVHGRSPRVHKPFVPVNCGAIPETLLESELFGYVKGAFTGAVNARKGRVAMAEGGTLFLDEIGELPLSLQVKLLRLLQEKTYEPVGSSDSVSANFRLVAATNRDLAEEVRAGRFRRDLYYRLHVCPVRLPALRERRDDVRVLFLHFWTRRGDLRPLEPAVFEALRAYDWPGNVRELENLVERVSVCAEGDVIRVTDLPIGVRAPHLTAGGPADGLGFATSMIEPSAREEEPDDDARDVLLGTPADISGLGSVPTAEVTRLEVARPSTDADDVTESAASSAIPGALPREILDAPTAEIPPGQVSWDSLQVAAAELREQARAARAAASPSEEPVARLPGEGTPTPIIQFPIDLPTMLRDLENAYINAALEKTGSNKKEAAKLLGMGRTTLVEKLRRRASDVSRS
jgi:sigma-54 specific flagellar transcriptional regulator A